MITYEGWDANPLADFSHDRPLAVLRYHIKGYALVWVWCWLGVVI